MVFLKRGGVSQCLSRIVGEKNKRQNILIALPNSSRLSMMRFRRRQKDCACTFGSGSLARLQTEKSLNGGRGWRLANCTYSAIVE